MSKTDIFIMVNILKATTMSTLIGPFFTMVHFAYYWGKRYIV